MGLVQSSEREGAGAGADGEGRRGKQSHTIEQKTL